MIFTMKPYIQLFADNDYIVPVADGPSSGFVKYGIEKTSRRIYDFKSNVAELRNFASGCIHEPVVDIVLHFPHTVGIATRREFVNLLDGSGFHVKSFSVEFNNLLVEKILLDHPAMKPGVGQHILVLQSSGNDLILIALTYCNKKFMQSEIPSKVSMHGREFIKDALVRMIVDKYEAHYHTLMANRLEEEYAYQLQFAEKWLEGRDSEEDLTIKGFAYSESPTNILPPIDIDGKELRQKEEQAMRDTLGEISTFLEKNIKNELLHLVMVGDLFKEALFREKVTRMCQCQDKATYANDNWIQEALHCYSKNQTYLELEEDIHNLESSYNARINEYSKVKVFVQNAETLASLQSLGEECREKIEIANDTLRKLKSSVEEGWVSAMKKSNFDSARGVLCTKTGLAENTDAVEFCRKFELLYSANSELLTSIIDLEDTREIIAYIREVSDRIQSLHSSRSNLDNFLAELKGKTNKYEELYPKYLEKRKAFNLATNAFDRRLILKDMQALTLESLPLVDVENVSVNIVTEVEMSKGGFFKKSKPLALKVDVVVGGEKGLLFDCELYIEPNLFVKSPETGGIATIEKGTRNTQGGLTFPIESLPSPNTSGELYVMLFPTWDNKHLNNTLCVNDGNSIKVKLK